MDLYDHYIYQPDFMAICFVVKKEIADWGMQIPLIFRSREASKEAFCQQRLQRKPERHRLQLDERAGRPSHRICQSYERFQ